MAESLRSKVEEHLTCSICLEQLKDPKVLPCLHSYCHECIVRLARNAKSINCPECRMTVKVDDPQNISTLPSNFFVNNLLATMALTNEKAVKTIVCDGCDSGDLAETRCKECGIFLCQYCTGFHRRSRATKVHELVSMDELKSNVGPETIAEKVRCPKHKEEVIKLFCKTCQVTICRDCTIVDHRQHEYGFVEDVAFQEKQKLQKNLDEVKERKVRVVQGISSLKKFDEGLIAKQKSTLLEINKHFDDLVKVMAVRRRELIAKATLLTSLKQKQIRAQLEQLEMALATCDSSIEFTEQAFKNGNDVQILSMEKCILQSLENLKKVKDQTQPCVSEQIVFCIPSSVKNTKQTLFNAYAVEDVVVSPEECTSSFNEPESHLELGKQFSITVICNDKNKKRLRFGGQLVKPMFSGIEVSNVTVTDNKDGSHVVKFTPTNQGGMFEMLKFEVTVDGKPAPLCSLTKQSVRWVISDAYGCGPITNNGLTMSGQSCDGEYCWRIGWCCFESGVYTWKVGLQYDDQRVPQRRVTRRVAVGQGGMGTEIGIIDRDEINGDVLNSQKKWVYTFAEGENVDISLTLNMENKTLQILCVQKNDNILFGLRRQRMFAQRANYSQDSGRNYNYRNKFQFSARQVLPFFACSSPSVTLSLVDVE